VTEKGTEEKAGQEVLTVEVSEAYIANNGLSDPDRLAQYLASQGFLPDRPFIYRKEGDSYVFEQEVLPSA
jgi:hypothetical protein